MLLWIRGLPAPTLYLATRTVERIKVYFHRFSEPLPPEKSPEPPITALKMLSCSIQANPGRAWRELVLMTILFH
jgi:hypothetical protein